MLNRKVALNRQAIVATGLLLAITVAPVAWADQKLSNLKRPLKVQLETPVQSANASVGQAFAAKLTEPVHYKSWTLPAGTEFKGHISKFGHSKHFGRPGYVILQTDSATLPNGQTLNFDAGNYKPRNRALRSPDTETFWQSVGLQLPYTIIGLGVTLPLHYAADTPWEPLILVGEAVRIGAGAVGGLFRPKYKNEPVARKLALGGLDGSGIPRVVNFIGTYPEADYQPGDQVKLYLDPKGLDALFHTTQTASLASPSAVSTVEPAVLQK